MSGSGPNKGTLALDRRQGDILKVLLDLQLDPTVKKQAELEQMRRYHVCHPFSEDMNFEAKVLMAIPNTWNLLSHALSSSDRWTCAQVDQSQAELEKLRERAHEEEFNVEAGQPKMPQRF